MGATGGITMEVVGIDLTIGMVRGETIIAAGFLMAFAIIHMVTIVTMITGVRIF